MSTLRAKLKTSVCALMLSTILSVPVFAESLNDALQWAYKNNPDILAARAEVKSAVENIEISKAAKRPTLSLSSNYGVSNSDIGNSDSYDAFSASLTAQLLVYDGGQTDMAIEATKAAVRSAQANLTAFEQKQLLATVQAYLNVLRDQELLNMQEGNVALLAKQVSSSNAAFDAGAMTLVDVSATKASFASAEAQRALAIANLEASRQNYKALTGHDAGALQAVGVPTIPSNESAVKEKALKFSPTIAAAVENERQALYNLRRAERAQMPTVSMSASATHTDPLSEIDASQSGSVGVNLAMPITTGGRNAALERQAKAGLEKASQDVNSARASVAQTAAIAWANYVNAGASVEANQSIVSAQNLANEGAAVEFELGASTIIDKLEAEQELLSAQANSTSASYSKILSAYNVLAAMGMLNLENLGLAPRKAQAAAPTAVVQEVPKTKLEKAVEQVTDRWSKP